MSIRRKPPPPISLKESTIENDIDSYIRSSPLTKSFRQENPNLQQLDDGDDLLLSTSSLHESCVKPDTLMAHSTTATSLSSSHLNQDLESALSVRAVKNKFKRMSTNASLAKSFNILRTTGSNPPSISPSTTTSTTSSSFSNAAAAVQPFWKYHVLKFGKDLYLSTNPDLKHIYCRNGPGFYVQIINNGRDRYLMLFRDVIGIDKPPFMTIWKVSDTDFQIDKVGNASFSPPRYHDTSSTQRVCYNFQFLGTNWKIGTIPRTRISKMKRLRGDEDELKLIGKKNIYFYKNETNIAKGDDFADSQILGLFRPYEVKLKKKIIRAARNTINHQRQVEEGGDEGELTAGSNVSRFFQTGDGLYDGVNPVDDMPDENKLGWITVYENFPGLTEEHPLFDIIVGLTLAVGYDTTVRKGIEI